MPWVSKRITPKKRSSNAKFPQSYLWWGIKKHMNVT